MQYKAFHKLIFELKAINYFFNELSIFLLIECSYECVGFGNIYMLE